MASPKLRAADVPTPGPWLVRGEASGNATATDTMLGVEPATEDQQGGWPYLIRQNRPVEPGGCPLHLAAGIQRLADAKLMAAAPELADIVLLLLTSPALTAHDLDPRVHPVRDAAWELLMQVASHLEI